MYRTTHFDHLYPQNPQWYLKCFRCQLRDQIQNWKWAIAFSSRVICIEPKYVYHSQLLFVLFYQWISFYLPLFIGCFSVLYAFWISMGKSHNHIHCFIALNRRKTVWESWIWFLLPLEQKSLSNAFTIRNKTKNHKQLVYTYPFWFQCVPIQYPVYLCIHFATVMVCNCFILF